MDDYESWYEQGYAAALDDLHDALVGQSGIGAVLTSINGLRPIPCPWDGGPHDRKNVDAEGEICCSKCGARPEGEIQ